MRHIYILILLIFSVSCNNDTTTIENKNEKTDSKLFSKVGIGSSKIYFKNNIKESMDFNFLNYPYLYTGAGVAVGDIDNDGLQDVYFISNFGPNKLYKNEGDFSFKDVTVFSKTED